MASNDASANTNTSLQSSVAFLQIQKNANLKRSTSMNEDVFRIFRQTGRRIALIKQQVERERCTYLKDSYTEKNQLYKELAGIFHSKKSLNDNNRQSGGASLLSTVSLPVLCSRIRLKEDKNNDSDRHLSGHKALKGLRSINVNVLKRCECCRRRAFRTIDNGDDVDDGFDEEVFPSATSGQTPDNKTHDKAKTNVARKKSQTSKTGGNKQKTALVQFSRYDHVPIPSARQKVQAGTWALKKQTKEGAKSKKKSVSFQGNGSTTCLNHVEEKAASTTPALITTSRPTLKSRASVKLECQASKSNERVRLEGNDWTSHVENIQEKKNISSSTVSGLSKAYCAFRNVLKKMEDQYYLEQFTQDQESRTESRAEMSGSRPASNMSRTDARWLPLRRTSDTLSICLNSWTSGTLESACMDSFNENGKEEEKIAKVETKVAFLQ